jgi:DNA polymerase I-like protein with 3'-5' exonuclease and polymerase domains
MPYAAVAPYAKADTTILVPLYKKLAAEIAAQDLSRVFDVEMGIMRYLLFLKNHGVRIYEAKRQKVAAFHEEDKERRERAWFKLYPGVNYNSTKQLAELFTRYGVPFAVSPGGKKELLARLDQHVDPKRLPMVDAEPLFAELKMSEQEQKAFRLKFPSITHDVLEDVAEDYPLAREVEELKQVDKTLGTFINGALLTHQVAGRIHPTFLPTASDDGGTVSGRLACQAPNLQQMGTPKGTFDPMVRDCFIPEDDAWWIKCDYSQIEYRLLVHYAKGPKADVVQKQYIDDPSTDYHALVQSWTGLERSNAKRLNFGVAYFMGAKSMSRKFHWPLERAYELLDLYMETVPFLVPTREAVVDVAKRRGYIKTILGRRCRISPSMKRDRKEFVAFNRLLQGGSADLMKLAMKNCWDSGVFNSVTPLVNVHDDSSISCPKTKEGIDAAREMQHIMETCWTFKIPIKADCDVGPNWGKVDSFEWSDLYKEIQ